MSGADSGGLMWGKLEWDESLARLLPGWLRAGEAGLVPLASSDWARLPERGGRSKAWLANGAGAARELLGDGGWRLEPGRLLSDILREKARMPGKPFYLKQPFPVHKLPGPARQAVARLLAWLHAGRNWMDPRAAADALAALMRASGADAGLEEFPLEPASEGEPLVCLTHDADSSNFQRRGDASPLLELDRRYGFKATWFLTTGIHALDYKFLDGVHQAGNELAWHDTAHDHRLAYLSPESMAARAEESRDFRERYGVCGVRSPNYLRSGTYFEVLGKYFSYDSSRHDSYPPREGSGTCRPFRDIGGILQLPVTVQEDFLLAGRFPSVEETAAEQIRQLESIRKRGGLAVLNTHPEPEITENPRGLAIYEAVLKHISSAPKRNVLLLRDVAQRCAGKGDRLSA